MAASSMSTIHGQFKFCPCSLLARELCIFLETCVFVPPEFFVQMQTALCIDTPGHD